MSGPRLPLSAAFITLNEEENLPAALASVAFCDEVVVVDSGSSDGTAAVAGAAGARVVHHPWAGFRDQKNVALSHCRHDWVLCLDADERVSPELARQIQELFGNGPPPLDGYEIPRLSHYLGRWIRHAGWYPDRKIRLFRRSRGRWVGGAVHERVEVEGEVGRLSGDLHHYTYRSVAQHLEALNRYTTLAAEDLHARGRQNHWSRWTLEPVLIFFKKYIAQRGFLDGFPGFVVSASSAWYVFVKQVKLREIQERAARVSRPAAQEPERSGPPAP